MYPKYKIIKLLDEIVIELIVRLAISKLNYEFHVVHSKTKNKSNQKLIKGLHDAVAGVILPHPKKGLVKVIIFYDKCKNKKDAIGSILHELLHVAYNDMLRKFLKAKTRKQRNKVEEEFVVALENTHLFLLSKRFKR